MAEKRFLALNNNHLVGVFDQVNEVWVVEPEYSWTVARTMAECLNDDPDMDPDELTRIARVQR